MSEGCISEEPRVRFVGVSANEHRYQNCEQEQRDVPQEKHKPEAAYLICPGFATGIQRSRLDCWSVLQKKSVSTDTNPLAVHRCIDCKYAARGSPGRALATSIGHHRPSETYQQQCNREDILHVLRSPWMGEIPRDSVLGQATAWPSRVRTKEETEVSRQLRGFM
jgi:hypothetical protein